MKRVFLFLMALLPLAAMAAEVTRFFNGPTWQDYRNQNLEIGYRGTFDNPIIIETAEDLAQLAWLVNDRHLKFEGQVVVLAADIDLMKTVDGQRVSWIPIGLDGEHPFEGIFLGCDHKGSARHTVKGMYIDMKVAPKGYGVGLFGHTSAFVGYVDLVGAEVKVHSPLPESLSVGLLTGFSRSTDQARQFREKSDGAKLPMTKGIYSIGVEGRIAITGTTDFMTVGGVAGTSSLSVCHSTAMVTISNDGECQTVGGIVGEQEACKSGDDNTVIDCMAHVSIRSASGLIDAVGGIAGKVGSCTVRGCATAGTIVSTGRSGYNPLPFSIGCGGIVGYATSHSRVEGCASTASLEYRGWTGGIVGTTQYHPDSNPYIDCCFYGGHIDAKQAAGAGGILGNVNSSAGQLVNSCLFAGTMNYPADSKTCGAILGKSANAESEAASCYYDSQLFSGTAAGGVDRHTTIKGLTIRELTSGNQSATPLLTTDQGDCHFTLREGCYPAVACNSKWEGYAAMAKNNLQGQTARQMYGSDMLTANSVALPLLWFASQPVAIQPYDFAYDMVSTLTFRTVSYQWDDQTTGIKADMTATLMPADAPCIKQDGEDVRAVSPGTTMLTFQLKTKNRQTSVARPALLGATRQMMLCSTAGKVWDGKVGTGCAAGTGKAEDPYIIKNGSQLAYAIINNKEGEFYEQVCDILLFKNRLADPVNPNASQNLWMDSSWPDQVYEWKASYDGKGHYVKGACIWRLANGLFGSITSTGSVANLGIVDSRASRRTGLFAYRMNGVITNCIAQGSVSELDIPNVTLPLNASGGICSFVGDANASAYIEDCITAVYSKNYTFQDYSPFVCLHDGNRGVVRHCLAVVPFSHRNQRLLNDGTTASGKSYIQQCYWLKGYEEANSGQTLDEIQQQLGSRPQWQVTRGYLPTLKTFAHTDMAKLLMVPFRTDVDYTYDAQQQQSDHYLLDIGRQITFEPGAATWTAVNDPSASYVETDGDMGVVVPVKASYDIGNPSLLQNHRLLPGLVFITGTLGDDRFPVPLRTRRGHVNAGFTFADDNARQACLAAFDANRDNILTLTELKAATNEQTLTAFQTATARQIRTFPEFRFFKNVTLLTSQLNGLSRLETVQLPYALQTIGSEAFKGCSSLREVIVPSKVTGVEPRAFYGSAVDSILVDPFNTTFTSRSGVLFTRRDGLVAYPNGRSGDETVVSGTVSSIAAGAFYKVPGLRRIFFDTTDYTTVPQLAEGALVVEDQPSTLSPQPSALSTLMDVYVSDATNGHVLMNEYMEDASWKAYVDAGKLHQYYPLKITDEAGAAWPAADRAQATKHYVGTLYIGFATQLPEALTPYVVNSIKETDYKAYYHEKSRLVPAQQPVIVMAQQPGIYRLMPAQGDLERWPVYANQLVGVGCDGMRVNQSTSAQGSIMTLQQNESGNAAFLYEKKKEIAPYHCYLPFPTIDRPAELVRNAHYDLVYARQATQTVYVGDYRFEVETLLPDDERQARLVSYTGAGGYTKVPAKLSDGTPVTQLGSSVFSKTASHIDCLDMSALENLEAFDSDRSDAGKPLGGLSPDTYVYLSGSKATSSPNVILGDYCADLRLYEGSDFMAPCEFHADRASYDRTFAAIDNGDGTWTSKAYSLCLPFECALTQCVDNLDDVSLYYLYAVDTESGEFIFTNDDSEHISAGAPYMLVVNKGSVTLRADGSNKTLFMDSDIDVLAAPTDDNLVSIMEGDKEVGSGMWRGTYRQYSNDECAAMPAYILQSDGTFRRVRNDEEPYRLAHARAFRAIFVPETDLNRQTFKIRYLFHEEGGEGGDGDGGQKEAVQRFPSDVFDTDGDMPHDEETGIESIDDLHIYDLPSDGNAAWYTLDGRRLSGKPAQKGIYVHHGRKVIIQ